MLNRNVLGACILIGASFLAFGPAQSFERGHRLKARHFSAQPLTEARNGGTSGGYTSSPRFTSADGGKTVHDSVLHVTWLVDADFPKKKKYGLPINTTGSMDYDTAQAWVKKLRDEAYLGHKDWQLPMTPPDDKSCNTRGPGHERFGYNCIHSAMGSIFYDKNALGLAEFQTAVPIAHDKYRGFSNFQPYLYWTSTAGNNKSPTASGYVTFSFATGWAGSNVYQHVMYVLPMLPGNLFGASSSSKNLQPVAGGEALYDPATDITWAADANLAARPAFHVSGVNPDGSMEQPKNGSPDPATVAAFLSALNGGKGYLGKSKWQLPSANLGTGLPCGGFDCKDSPMGELFYRQFGLGKGETTVTTPDIKVGPFRNIQPYLYWSCEGVVGKPTCNGKAPAKKFAWSFSFGNGFEGTDLEKNDLFVMVYYPDGPKPPAPPPPPPPLKCHSPMTCCTVHGGIWSGGKCI